MYARAARTVYRAKRKNKAVATVVVSLFVKATPLCIGPEEDEDEDDIIAQPVGTLRSQN